MHPPVLRKRKRGAAALACMDRDGSEDVDQLQSGGHLTLVYELDMSCIGGLKCIRLGGV